MGQKTALSISDNLRACGGHDEENDRTERWLTKNNNLKKISGKRLQR